MAFARITAYLLATMTDETDSITIIHGNLVNDEGFQNVSNCDKDNESQQLGESWFSPPITSTQIVSFDLISSDGDFSQDELLLGNEKHSADGTISSDEIMLFTDPAYLLALSPLCDQTNVSETPPPQGESLNWENRNVTDYLFNSSNLITVESSNNISIQTIRAPSKRMFLQEKSKKSAKIKKPKVEGYSCKLNGTMYQVFSRDLDVLEAIERGLKVIQEKIRQQGMCNVRPLCLQLNQIETVMGILDNEQLELGMPLEVWKEMMALTKAMFNETLHEVNLCKKKRFELETFTDELTTSFSHSFNISGSEQTKEKSSQQPLTFNKRDENTEKILVRTPDATASHFESQVLRNDMTVEIEQEENGIQLSGVSQQLNDTITQESANEIPKKTPTQTTLRKQRSLRSSKKKSSKKSYAPNTSGTCEESHKSTLPRKNVLRMDTPTDGFWRPDEVDLNLPLAEDSIHERNPLHTLGMPSTDTTIPISGNYLEICRNSFSSTLNANESLLSQKKLQVNDSQLNPVRVTISNGFNSLQQIEEIVIAENVNATNYQDESFIVEASQNSTLSLFSGNRKCSPKIVMMSFNLHPFVLKGVLSPGKNNMKMNINNRIYIGSLTPDGTIEMNGFSFPTIGNWIKSVEGKRFGCLSRTVQKTLELQYNGKPLVEVLDEGGKLNKSLLKENVEISPSNFTQYPTLQPPKADGNLPPKTAPVIPVQNPPSHPQTTDEVGQKNAISNDLNTKEDLQLVPDEMTRHIKTIFLHAPDEYFPICQCVEQYWCGAQPFPKHLLDEVDSW